MNNSDDALIEFQNHINEIPIKIQSAYRLATQEATTLKVLGSPRLFALTLEFEKAHQEILELSSVWLLESNKAFTMSDFDSPMATKMKEKGKKIGLLQEKIIEQMRYEI